MTTKEIQAIFKQLLPNFPSFIVKGRMMLLIPLGRLMRGFYIDDSSFKSSTFFPSWFVMPLYVPTSTIYFNYGQKIKCSGLEMWDLEEKSTPSIISQLYQSMKRDGLPVLEKIKEPGQFALFAKEFSNRENPHTLEAIGYSLLLDGRHQDASTVLTDLKQKVLASNDATPWMKEIQLRADEVLRLLRHNPTKAVSLLNSWQKDTIRNLKLESLTDLVNEI